MSVYTGHLGTKKDLSYFRYIGETNYGPNGIYPEAKNGFLPIISESKNGFLILYFYKNKWLVYQSSYQ